jgi:hypothetical protein
MGVYSVVFLVASMVVYSAVLMGAYSAVPKVNEKEDLLVACLVAYSAGLSAFDLAV